MSIDPQPYLIFRFGRKTSLLSSLFTFLLAYILLGLTTGWLDAIPVSVIIFIGTYLITYYTIRSKLDKRLNKLYHILDNISNKNFEANPTAFITEQDELDHIMNLSVSTSKTIEGEIMRLKRIENYRKEFIGDVSHELKTPIFAIQGFIETLLNGALEDESVNRVFLKKAMRNVNRLIFLTQDLMEISKLETGDLKLYLRDMKLKPVIMEIVENLQYKADRENVALYVDSFDDNLTIKGDRNQLRQIINNLIDNAIKYNRNDGSVTVGVRPFAKDPERIEVYVKDTGIGIDQKDIDRITERFYRVDKSRSREKGGTGLGLSIVKHMIEAHGEQLFIKSAPKSGSTFSFTLKKADHFSD
ncbi:MAG TPA: ATP-binding protein [Balneolales bacterium]|nr:ATP-binding protein [Balneolales bacterium]